VLERLQRLPRTDGQKRSLLRRTIGQAIAEHACDGSTGSKRLGVAELPVQSIDASYLEDRHRRRAIGAWGMGNGNFGKNLGCVQGSPYLQGRWRAHFPRHSLDLPAVKPLGSHAFCGLFFTPSWIALRVLGILNGADAAGFLFAPLRAGAGRSTEYGWLAGWFLRLVRSTVR
jgi:hypothetical protein